MSGGAAYDRTQAREEFLYSKRLRQVIVGAGVDPFDLLAPTSARREDEDRQSSPTLPPTLQHAEPVHARQAKVQHRRDIVFRVAAKPGLLSVGDPLDNVSRLGQRAFDVSRDGVIVLDQQDAHQSSPALPAAPDAASTTNSCRRPSPSTLRNS